MQTIAKVKQVFFGHHCMGKTRSQAGQKGWRISPPNPEIQYPKITSSLKSSLDSCHFTTSSFCFRDIASESKNQEIHFFFKSEKPWKIYLFWQQQICGSLFRFRDIVVWIFVMNRRVEHQELHIVVVGFTVIYLLWILSCTCNHHRQSVHWHSGEFSGAGWGCSSRQCTLEQGGNRMRKRKFVEPLMLMLMLHQ